MEDKKLGDKREEVGGQERRSWRTREKKLEDKREEVGRQERRSWGTREKKLEDKREEVGGRIADRGLFYRLSMLNSQSITAMLASISVSRPDSAATGTERSSANEWQRKQAVSTVETRRKAQNGKLLHTHPSMAASTRCR